MLWTGFLCQAAWKTGIESVLCCCARQMAEIRLSPLNISQVILEMGEEKHAVSDIKCPLLFAGFKQNISTKRNFWNTTMFKISSTFFELIRVVESKGMDGKMIGQKDDGRMDGQIGRLSRHSA